MNIYTNELGHMTKMAAMYITCKKSLEIFFSGTNAPISFKLGMLHHVLKLYQNCSNDDFGLTMTYLRQGQIWENANS